MNQKRSAVASWVVAQSATLNAVEPNALEAGVEKGKKSTEIALFGLFGCGNLGNDGSLQAMSAFLRDARPDAHLVCICDNPEVVERTCNIATSPISPSRYLRGLAQKLDRIFMKVPGKLFDLVQTFRCIRKAEIMIVPGTGILDDFGERPYGMPLDILRWCLAARLAGTKIAFVSIGAGPIRHPLNRWLMATAARLAHYRSYRDAVSKDFMQSIGFDTRQDPIYPDIVFGLKPPGETSASERSARLTVGVGVMSYYGWYGFADGGASIFEKYIGKLAQFVFHLLDNDYDVRLLTGELADKTAIDALMAVVTQARPNVSAARLATRPLYSLHDVMTDMSGTDFVVATRFHTLVCAMMMGRPTISIGYAKKNDVLMAEMGLGAYCQHVETFEVQTLIDQFSRLVTEREACENAIRLRTLELKRQLEEQDDYLLSTFLAPNERS